MGSAAIFMPSMKPSNKKALQTLILILLGAAMYGTVLMIMRFGGMPRVLFVVMAIAIGYLFYSISRQLTRKR